MLKKLLLLLTATSTILLPTAEASDWGGIHDYILKYSINDEWAVYNRYETISRDDFEDTYFGLIDLGLAYKLDDHWTLSGYYRQCWLQSASTGDWSTEHRPLVELNYGTKLNDIALSSRSRLEFRIYEGDKEDDMRYRNRLRADMPWDIVGIKPYLEEELFFSDNYDGFFGQNWLTAGVYYKIDHVKLRVGYRWQASKSGNSWKSKNLLATNLMFFF
ncbi:DUF2490 domain-containing protein [Pontiella sp.]|uniref:DUF2490 domain-containing protein n=1 Tax=Pontiella sp. TaxID=2837462 RepID=UPI0035670173